MNQSKIRHQTRPPFRGSGGSCFGGWGSVYIEFLHIFRDRRTMLILLVMPIVQIILFGFAITTEVKNVRVAVLDPSNDVVTRRITDRMDASEYFTVVRRLPSPAEMEASFKRGEIDMALVFGERFADKLYTGEARVQLVSDATDPNMATMQAGYATNIIASAGQEMLPPGVRAASIVPQLKMLYNPQMKSAYNFVPGVMGLILMLICAMMTSISIVREKEMGTMEVLLVSPVKPLSIILAKAVPYFVLSFVNLATILLLSVYVLDVPVAGSLFWLVVVSLLFIFVSLALGLLISTITHTQVAAMLVSGLVLMMPTMLLSGMIFPIESMPLLLQGISAVLPARWYIQAVRKLMIEGVDISLVLMEVGILAAMAVLLVTVSLKKFQVRLTTHTHTTLRPPKTLSPSPFRGSGGWCVCGVGVLLSKEFTQLFRNPFLPKLIFIFPCMIMLLMPWAANLEIKNIRLNIVDNDHSVLSRRLVDKIGVSTYFRLTALPDTYREALLAVEEGSADVVLEIPRGFEKEWVKGETPRLLVAANAVNGTKGGLGGSYLSAIIGDYARELGAESPSAGGTGRGLPRVSVTTQNLYNPTLNYKLFMVPALMVMLLTLICGFLPALNVVGEKEAGTIEQINVTPVRKFTFIVAKLLPYWLIGLVVLTICFVLAWLLYGILPAGHFLTIYGVALLFLPVVSGFGLVISNYSSTMQQAMFVMWFFMLVLILMSGLFTPIHSMPEWAQWITRINPLRYFVEVMRTIYLRGGGFAELLPQLGALLAFALVANLWAVKSYRKSG